MKQFLRAEKRQILDENRKCVQLRGTNLGGWLMMEAYFLHTPNLPVQSFKKKFTQLLGPKALEEFEKEYHANFIRESDIAKITKWGFNCLRVPFHYKLVEKSPYNYDSTGIRYLDRVLQWGAKYKIWMILDLHAAPGAQNHDWHSDSLGQAQFWTKKVYQDRALALWEFLADRYKNVEWLAGYDILNEAVTQDVKALNQFYTAAIKRIRSVDRHHILFIEGNHWARDLDCLEAFDDNNFALSIHFYEPLDFTFNFVPHLKYPLREWDRDTTERILAKYHKIATRRQVPIYVGEFGVNNREGKYNEQKWVKDTVACFEKFGFHWTYWPYKSVKNSVFPDGILSFFGNPPWVNRQGPVMGWDTYHLHWPKCKREMIRSWRTDQFTENTEVLKVLTSHGK